jgi:hypothetical protein
MLKITKSSQCYHHYVTSRKTSFLSLPNTAIFLVSLLPACRFVRVNHDQLFSSSTERRFYNKMISLAKHLWRIFCLLTNHQFTKTSLFLEFCRWVCSRALIRNDVILFEVGHSHWYSHDVIVRYCSRLQSLAIRVSQGGRPTACRYRSLLQGKTCKTLK